ncbi:MAG TPA: hypothetical protein VEV21_10290 [Burkholderiales bacterium]|nr:hypothetical protein [Burkholderiales bacterium]
MVPLIKTKSIVRRATHDIGARTHYLSQDFEKSRKPREQRMVAIKRRHLAYKGNTARIVHTLADGRRVRYTIEVS